MRDEVIRVFLHIALNDVEKSVRYAAVEALSALKEIISKILGDEVRNALLMALGDPKWSVRYVTIEAFSALKDTIAGTLSDENTIKSLLNVLKDLESDRRYTAILMMPF